MEWFIQLHRKLIQWEWYDDINTSRLFIHLLLKSNWKDKNWRGIEIKRWEFLTSLWKLAEETSLSIQQVRTSLKKLKSTQEVTQEWHASYTIIKLTNYDSYQTSNTESNKPVTSEQQTSNKPVTTTNKVNNNNKENKDISIVATKVATLKDYIFSDINKEYFINNYNSTEEFIIKEMNKFYLYRSEKKPNWKKELWQMQKTFDVNLRFHNRLKNTNKFNTDKIEEKTIQNMTTEEKEKRLRDLWIL